MGRRVERTPETLQFVVDDYRSGKVGFYQHDINHLIDHHKDMEHYINAIVETIQDPDLVCYDLSEHASPNSQHYYKQTPIISNPKLCVKATVAYDDGTWSDGHFVTGHRVSIREKESERDENIIFKADREK